MRPSRCCQIARRVVVENFDIRHKTSARERPLDEVVTEQRVVGKAPFGRASKDIDVVDALSCERPLAEQILIDVRHGGRVRIDAGVA